ncbi:LysM peptidoglycan-binding domain-containing protein [Calidifontibacter sp. DB0510]|uniref:LysM peptidoglycan-binding domain-containing protein n=1 Tax=Metallococcus carri TaxID=1656884 RepID=A0A967B141_9MICO|nr:LysM domain-containing protein [Metallococcus carri]NHN56864.1 LysM peptidoglycan-binding domain-containing protein [Metallococcus carri]
MAPPVADHAPPANVHAVHQQAAAATATTWRSYTIRPGDTLTAIAKAHRTTVAALVAHNKLSTPGRILAGQQLQVPVAAPAKSKAPAPRRAPNPKTIAKKTTTRSGTPYVVRRGDTLIGIARAHHTSAAALAKANQIGNPNTLRAGEVDPVRWTS